MARLLRALRVGDVNQSVYLSLYIDAELFALRVIVVLPQVAFQRFDGAAFKELHRLAQFFAFVARLPHQLQFLVQRLQHIFLLLLCAPNLFIADVVDLVLNFADLLLQLFLDESCQPLLFEGEFICIIFVLLFLIC